MRRTSISPRGKLYLTGNSKRHVGTHWYLLVVDALDVLDDLDAPDDLEMKSELIFER